jgi:hypothetical protein
MTLQQAIYSMSAERYEHTMIIVNTHQIQQHITILMIGCFVLLPFNGRFAELGSDAHLKYRCYRC